MIDDLQIIDMVILERLINVADLEEARRQQKRDGGDLYNILIENGFVDEEKTIVALAHLLSIPCVGLRKFQPDPEVTSLVPCAMAAQMRLIPLSVSRQSDPPTLYLAMANPIDIIALDEVGELTGFDVVGYLAGPLEIARTLERCYGQAIYQQKVESRGGMLARTSGRDPFAGPSVSQLMDLPTLEEMSRSVRSQSVEAPADEPPLDLGKTRKPSSWSGELSDIDSVDDEVELASVEEEEVLHLPELSLRVRITLLILGWFMVLLGIIGIFLPILQGFAFIFIGLVMLSIASERVHNWLETLLRRSPTIQQRYQGLRHRLHLKFSRKK